MKYVGSILLLFMATFCSTSVNGQITEYTDVRQWTTPKGAVVKAKTVSRTDTSVRLLFAKSGKEFNVPLAKLVAADVAYLDGLTEKLPKKVLSAERKCVAAKDALVIYQRYLDSGFVPAEQQIEVSATVNELVQLAKSDGVRLTDEFIPRSELEERKKEADQIVDEWISKAKIGLEKETTELKRVSKFDPTSIDAAILESFCFEIYNHNHEQGGKILGKAIGRAEKFIAVASGPDKQNLIVAQNNLGVSHARMNKLSKAIKTWQEIIGSQDSNVPPALQHNVARALKLVSNNKGIDKKKDKELRDLKALHGQIRATGGEGGWHLMCPVDSEGALRVGLKFLETDFARVSPEAGLIIDARCVTCDGTCVANCGTCRGKGGRKIRVAVVKEVPIPGGEPIKVNGTETRWQNCNDCNATGRVECTNCTEGKQ